jgi:2-iminobutanoate/2-iminopropanoate deaminase
MRSVNNLVRLGFAFIAAVSACAAHAAGHPKADRGIIATPLAPQPIGPYSQGVRVRDTVYVAGQIAIDPATQRMLTATTTADQTQRVLENIQAILRAAGLTLADVVSTTVYVRDLDDFEAMNAAYAKFFASRPPARATVQVARLPKDAKVEISAIAVRP